MTFSEPEPDVLPPTMGLEESVFGSTRMSVYPGFTLYQYIQVLLKGDVAPPVAKVKSKVFVMMVVA